MIYRNFESMPLTLTVRDIADTLSIGMNRAYALVNEGQLKSLRIGNQIRIPRDCFKAFLSTETESA